MENASDESSFHIYYRGGLAEKGLLNAADFAESLMGAARLYGVLAHYSVLGYVPRKRKAVEVYTKSHNTGGVRRPGVGNSGNWDCCGCRHAFDNVYD